MNWNTSKEEMETICDITTRYIDIFPSGSRIDLEMDITACHCNGNPLKLNELLNADDFNFVHDITGIKANLNRTNGKLLNCFSPRFSVEQQ